MKINKMLKLESPFVREKIDGKYVVTPKIAEDYEWVFKDDSVKAIEKLHGMNVSIYVNEQGIITHIWTKGRRVQFFNMDNQTVIKGLLNSYNKGYMEFLLTGQHFGELIGPGSQSNLYRIKEPLWIPFETHAKGKLYYKSWGKYPKTFEAISEWFKTLLPLYCSRVGSDSTFVEGIVFTHPDGRMAKLRKDMFDWFEGPRHKGGKK